MEYVKFILRRGDTLTRICEYFEITLEELLVQNPQITNPNLIYSGDEILIPASNENGSIHKFLALKNITTNLPDWLKIAMREEGTKEFEGNRNNPVILEYHQTTTLNKELAKKDETAWCSSFTNWCMREAGIPSIPNSAWALDWKNWGNRLDEPREGAIAVFSRKNLDGELAGGHVGFYLHGAGNFINILGGNQRNMVKESMYPVDGRIGKFLYKLESYRWPA